LAAGTWDYIFPAGLCKYCNLYIVDTKIGEKMEHTKTPWHVWHYSKCFIEDEINNCIAHTMGANLMRMEIEDNAAFIVHACNMHDELMEALKNALARMDENPPKPAKKGDLDAVYKNATFCRDREAARAAIEKGEA
jgi:hypothetical protein